MALVVVTAANPESMGPRRLVRAVVALDGNYPSGGYPLKPIEFNLSAIVDVEDAIGEGWVLRFVDGIPPRLAVYGAAVGTANMEEAAGGEDLSAVESARLRVWGW